MCAFVVPFVVLFRHMVCLLLDVHRQVLGGYLGKITARSAGERKNLIAKMLSAFALFLFSIVFGHCMLCVIAWCRPNLTTNN